MVEQATLAPAMFADSLLETSWAHRSRRGWTALTSFGVQMVAIALLLLIPILTTVSSPGARSVSTPISFVHASPGPAPQPHSARNSPGPVIASSGHIIAPGHIPTTIARGGDAAPGGPIDEPGPIGDFVGSGPGLPLPFSGTRPVMPTIAPPPAVTRAFRTSQMLEGSLTHRVDPPYPPMAKAARIQGPVQLEAVIARDGTIKNLRLLSGHPLLVSAALAAVSQWRYRPYILNGEAIEVETRITVNFILGGN
jgi:periplasmic protein TonB